MNAKRWIGVLGVVFLPAVPNFAGAEEPLYYITDLGTLGGMDSMALGINDQGTVVGWAEVDSPGHSIRHAFVWTPDHAEQPLAMTDLGTLGGDHSEAHAVNNREQVVGLSTTATGQQHAFYWFNGAMFDLNEMIEQNPVRTPTARMYGAANCQPRLRYLIEANAINDRGVIVACGLLWSDAIHGFVLTPKDPYAPEKPRYEVTDLGVLPGTGDCVATGVSPMNEVVGFSGGWAFAWTANGGIAELDGYSKYSEAAAINTLGTIAGTTGLHRWNTTACIWQDGMRYDLGLPGWISWANALNDAGVVVGMAAPHMEGPPHAMMWSGCIPYDLNDVDMINFEAWEHLAEATAVDETGQIAGYGFTRTGSAHAYLLTPMHEE